MVGTGINGMDIARIQTGGSLKCKYIQNCFVEAGGDIFADSIMYCQIECNGSMELSGRRGVIIGGKTLVANTIEAKAIGTPAHAPTQITMAGGSLSFNRQLTDIKKNVSALDTELITMIQTISWCNDLLKNGKQLKPFQQHAFEQSKKRLQTIQDERNEKLKEMEEIQERINEIDPSECFIKVSGRIHTGVKILFGTQILQVNGSYVNSRVFLKEGSIAISPI